MSDLISLPELKREAKACQRCPLSKTRSRVVFGGGNGHAKIMLVGEAPGEAEDRKGAPFIGHSGVLLEGFLRRLNLPRSEIYITNILKCRPPGDRDFLPTEAKACSSFLRDQIRNVRPEAILALGREAAVHLLGLWLSMDAFREKLWTYQDPGASLGIPVVVTYPPTYLLENRTKPLFKTVWSDFQKIQLLTEKMDLDFCDDDDEEDTSEETV